MKQYRLAIFASGNGSNAEQIVAYFKDHQVIETALILSNNANAFVLERASRLGIPSRVFDRITFRESQQVLDWLREAEVTHIVLAGFLWLVPPYLIEAYPDRIINIHPSLLPKHGGKGMFGMKVHDSVRSSGDLQTGITIHLVNEHYDEGAILLQATCDVLAGDTAESIAGKVHALEYEFYAKTIEEVVLGQA